MKTDSVTPESAAGAGSSPSSGSAPVLFPRNPERDQSGRAVLYPGLPKFEGVCGLFTTDEGEVAIIAPTFEALDAHVRKMGVSAEVSREACILATWDRVPNKQIQESLKTDADANPS